MVVVVLPGIPGGKPEGVRKIAFRTGRVFLPIYPPKMVFDAGGLLRPRHHERRDAIVARVVPNVRRFLHCNAAAYTAGLLSSDPVRHRFRDHWGFSAFISLALNNFAFRHATKANQPALSYA